MRQHINKAFRPNSAACALPPASADAPVTPASGPAIGFWLRPFNYFDESAAAGQPGMVYMPALTQQQAEAAGAAAAAGNDTFTLAAAAAAAEATASNASSAAAARAGAGGPSGLDPNNTGLGRDDMIALVTITGAAALTVARRGVQPYVGVPLRQQCMPRMPSVPFNGSYAPYFSATLSVPPGTLPVAAPSRDGLGGPGAANGSVPRNTSTPDGGSATLG
jgi:hypothetical protein